MAISHIHVKVDSDIKQSIEKILERIGISMSDLVNMTMRRVIIERRLPFDTTVPEIEMPKRMSVDTAEAWQNLIDDRMDHDDGTRYTAQDIKESLGLEKVAVVA